MRLPYAPSTPPNTDARTVSVYEATTARRAPRPLQPLDLALLHSPALTGGWNSFIGAVRTQTSLSASVRELAISRVAVLNGAWYEWHHHAPMLRDALQAERSESSDAITEALRTVLEEPCLGTGQSRFARQGRGLSEPQWAVLDYADQMTRHVRVDEEVFGRLRDSFGESEGPSQKVVELTGVIAAYACVSRFLVALDVGEGNAQKMEVPT